MVKFDEYSSRGSDDCGLDVACGSDSSPTEDGLRDRADTLLKATGEGRWATAYGFLSPESKSQCTSSEYAISAGAALAAVKGLLGLAKSEPVEYGIGDVIVEDNRGRVFASIYFDGVLFENNPEDEFDDWTFVDGEWRLINPGDCRTIIDSLETLAYRDSRIR